MTTAKKTSSKKPVAKKTVTKSTTTKQTKAATKKPSAPVARTKKSAAAARNESDFMSFNPTIQTVYWVVLGLVCIVFALWITKLQSDINAIYDSIDATNSEIYTLPEPKKHHN